jgi:hypothetical protein
MKRFTRRLQGFMRCVSTWFYTGLAYFAPLYKVFGLYGFEREPMHGAGVQTGLYVKYNQFLSIHTHENAWALLHVGSWGIARMNNH